MFILPSTLVFCLILEITSLIQSDFLKNYDLSVCKNERTCHLLDVPNLPKSRFTVEGRDCMCDFECPEYNDCCEDSEFYGAPIGSNTAYYCSPNAQIYMIVSCPVDYSNDEIKSKCEASIYPRDGDDASVIRPVTNLKRRLTYGNSFCAQCNDDLDNFEFWNLTVRCEKAFVKDTSVVANSPDDNEILRTYRKSPVRFVSFAPRSVRSQWNIRRGKRDSYMDGRLLKNARYNANEKHFVTQHNGENLICQIDSKLPQDYDLYVRKCVPNLVSSCPPDTSADLATQCGQRMAIVYEKATRRAFKNKDCAKCNGISELSLTGCPKK